METVAVTVFGVHMRKKRIIPADTTDVITDYFETAKEWKF